MGLASVSNKVTDFFNHRHLDQFGFAHESFVPENAMERRLPEASDMRLEIGLMVASWIPIVGGQVAGTAYINRGGGDFNAKTIRGNMAIAFMGPILLAIDLIVTLGRLLGKSLELLSRCTASGFLGAEKAGEDSGRGAAAGPEGAGSA